MDMVNANPLQSVLVVTFDSRDVACAKPENYSDLEDMCRREFGIPDDSKLVFTTTDLAVSLGRSVELHRSQSSWAMLKGLVQRVTLELHDDKFKISIACNLQVSSPPGVLQFQTRFSQLIANVLGGACAAFGVNKHGTRLVLLRLERADDIGTMVERRYVCNPGRTVFDSGIQPGSRLSIEPDPDAPPPPAPLKNPTESPPNPAQHIPGQMQDRMTQEWQMTQSGDRQRSPGHMPAGQMLTHEWQMTQAGDRQRSPGLPPDRHMSGGQVHNRQLPPQPMHDRRSMTEPNDMGR